MQRRDFLKTSLWGAAALSLAAPLDLWAAPEETYKLTILHTNDMHSRIDPFPDGGGNYAGMGGMARRAALIEKIRQQEPNVLLLDAGDIFQGTPYFNFFGGELEFKLMSKMQYDAATMGNHDFDAGLEGFVKQLPHAAFPFLTANYDFSRTPVKGLTQPYKIFQKGKIRVGVFGLGIKLEGLVPKKMYEQTIYNDPIAVGKEMVQELRAKGCHLVVCLSHLGFKHDDPRMLSDQHLSAQVEGIDLIIGGHTHTLLEKPAEMKTDSGGPVLVNQVGWGGVALGKVDFHFTRNMEKKSAEGTALLLPAGIDKS